MLSCRSFRWISSCPLIWLVTWCTQSLTVMAQTRIPPDCLVGLAPLVTTMCRQTPATPIERQLRRNTCLSGRAQGVCCHVSCAVQTVLVVFSRHNATLLFCSKIRFRSLPPVKNPHASQRSGAPRVGLFANGHVVQKHYEHFTVRTLVFWCVSLVFHAPLGSQKRCFINSGKRIKFVSAFAVRSMITCQRAKFRSLNFGPYQNSRQRR